MSPAAPPKVDEELWAGALLAADTELLLGAARNYLGPVRTPYDKREIVERLAAFLRRAEVREAVVELLDRLDARILGSFFLLGPMPEAELRSLFEGELPLFDLGLRVANLLDRLLLFRFELGGRRLLAPNPILAEDLESAVMDLGAVFGAGGKADSTRCAIEEARGAPAEGPVTARDAVALFAFLFHAPGGIRKGGGLTKKAMEKAQALLPGSVLSPPERLPVLLSAFDATGFLGEATESREPDLAGFRAALEAWGEELPAFLAAAAASEAWAAVEPGLGGLDPAAEAAAAVAAALGAAPEGFLFSTGGLGRWIETSLRRSRRQAEIGAAGRRDLVESILALGLVEDCGEGLRVRAPWRSRGAESGTGAHPSPSVVAEGSHVLHVLPEGGLAERLLAASIARPISFGTVWSLEVDRESARRAFASGIDAAQAMEGLSAAAGRALPQSLAFSLKSWEEEYRSLRLYRGFVLVADERLRAVVEHSRALAPHVAERLAPGVFVLAASSSEEAAALLEEAGLEAPPEIHHGAVLMAAEGRQGRGQGAPEAAGLDGSVRARLAARAREAVAPLAAMRTAAPRGLDPGPRIASLAEALASRGQAVEARSQDGASGQAELRELADRVERRLFLTPRQLEVAEVRPERMEASGLDYLGKVRIIEKALRGPGDRLEILCRLPGAEPERILARPTRLEKTEKGLVLEAENLGTGDPIRVSVGAISVVRRMRASLFGEET